MITNESFAGVRRSPGSILASSGCRTSRTVPGPARVGYAVPVLVHCRGGKRGVLDSLGRFLATFEIFKLYITDLVIMILSFVLIEANSFKVNKKFVTVLQY